MTVAEQAWEVTFEGGHVEVASGATVLEAIIAASKQADQGRPKHLRALRCRPVETAEGEA